MKQTFPSVTLAIVTIALILSASIVLNAQNREKFVISAKAGGVNAVSGRVEVKSFRGADWELLNVTDDLKAGALVKTGTDARVEMLLNPGSYLRAGENSEFELTDNSLDKLEVGLIRGTAIIEATGADETELAINITTPQAKMVIVKRGLYRVNVIPGDTTELFVRKGRVLLANSHTKVKEGDKVIFSSTAFSVAKLEKRDKQKDFFDTWSKQRAETVAQANRRISSRDLNAFLSTNDLWGYGFSGRSSGVWLFNPRSRCYTFMPFFMGWGSPYGASYSNPFFRGYDCCGFNPYDYGRSAGGTNSNPLGSAASSSGAGSGPGVGGSNVNPSPTRLGNEPPARGSRKDELPADIVRTVPPE